MKRRRDPAGAIAAADVRPRLAALLRAIDRAGSLSAAARSTGMSYRRARLALMSLNRRLGSPVVVTRLAGGGAVMLTPLGRAISGATPTRTGGPGLPRSSS